MTYSTFIHSGIVNPSKTSVFEKKEPEVVVIEYNLLAEILAMADSSARVKTLLEKIKELKDTGVLTKKAHSEAFNLSESEDNQTLDTIRKLAGI